MKKVLLILLLCLPFVSSKADDKDYLKGAVPESNGQVCFQQKFAVKGQSKQQIYEVMQNFVKQLMTEQIEGQRARISSEDKQSGQIVARCEEWMVFKKKPLYLDRTRFRYQLQVECEDGTCAMTLTQVSYYYEEDMDGYNGRTYKAEEWINDASALNKKGTKLTLGSAKFRRHTVDRVKQIFESARESFEMPKEESKRATQLIK